MPVPINEIVLHITTRQDRAHDRRPPALSRFELAARELRLLGITLTRLPGEYRVNFRAGPDATALMVETLDQALELGRVMAAEAPAPPGPAHGKRGRRPLRMTPKAIRRRMIRAHNRRIHALALKKALAQGTEQDSRNDM
jgi:hypothetical protein